MRKIKKIISSLLTVCMLLGSLSGIFSITAFAAEADSPETPEIDLSSINYLTEAYYTADQKLQTMEMRFEKGDYQIFVNDYTGEVAIVNTATGERLFSNPYDVGLSGVADSVKAEMLSQILIKYTGNMLTGEQSFNSYTDAALNKQIKVKSIKNGVRVEYTLGREETKYLVPRMITKERFETLVLNPIVEQITQKYKEQGEAENWSESRIESTITFEVRKFSDMFTLQDPESAEYKGSDFKLAKLYEAYPIITKVGAIYTIDSKITPVELIRLEELIKTYCPAYSFEELDIDHTMTEYVSEDQNPAVFKLSLEYILDDLGLTVTLPANGIRFDESIYQLSSITILPFMGASRYTEAIPNTGYTFLPDGSGAIFRFEDLVSGQTIKGNFYGSDYAYHSADKIIGKNQEIFRMPVYGLVRDNLYSYVYNEDTSSYVLTKSETPTSSGFFAIMEEGDALASVSSYHMSTRGDGMNTLQLTVNPRPSDSYVISGSGSKAWTVVSDRKYVGNYKIRYIMLTDDAVAAEKGLDNTYSASYFGMAEAYRDYLTSPYSTGTQNSAKEDQSVILTRLDSNQVESEIPLYLETFGSMETVEKVLSVPVTVMTPLTTFDDIQQMYEDLSQDGVGITNINFKMTGYANGGLYSTMPYKLKWEKEVGGADGFTELMEYAKEVNSGSAADGKHLGIFPEFDFSNVTVDKSFDGFSLSKHAVKTIDDRYTTKRTYSATFQTLESTGSLIVSPAYFNYFYNKLATNYHKYSLNGDGSDLSISVSTLGTDLNSDFDEDEPYNREDAKGFVTTAFKDLSAQYGSVMTSGGNAYTWQHADYILGLPIDGSRYLASSNAVPFTGIVLHGYKQYTGNPINMEGNIQYGLLKAIENGASIYFILTYDNATKLKEDEYYSRYYSVRYDIWAGSYNEKGDFEPGELVEVYNSLNDITKDLQTKLIINHELLEGMRVPGEDEILEDQRLAEEAQKAAEEKAAAEAEAKLRAELLEARVSALATALKAVEACQSTTWDDLVEDVLDDLVDDYEDENDVEPEGDELAKLEEAAPALALQDLLETVLKEAEKIQGEEEKLAADAENEKLIENIEKMKRNLNKGKKLGKFMDAYSLVSDNYDTVNAKIAIVDMAVAHFEASQQYSDLFMSDVREIQTQIHACKDQLEPLMAEMESYYVQVIEAGKGYIEVAEEEQVEEETVEEKTTVNPRYLIDDGSIVAVTYGEEGQPYRTFILNYNYYTISVEYNGETYEIDRYGYVAIDHKA